MKQLISEEKQKELSEKIEKYFMETGEGGTVTVSFNQDICTVHLSKMYRGLGNWISFKNMNWLSKLFDTDLINVRNEHYREGCESCDWGSEHSADLICQKIMVPSSSG